MGYKAGSLTIELFGIDNNATMSIKNTIKYLSKLSRAIEKINKTDFLTAGQKLESLFTRIATATNSINISNLNTLATVSKSLSALSRIGKLENIDFQKIGKGFEYLSVAITPFLNKVKEAEQSLISLNSIISKVGNRKTQGFLGNNIVNNTFNNFNLGFIYAKIRIISFAIMRIAQIGARILQYGVDYTETLNLWQTAMRENLSIAQDFVAEMNKAYGISEQTLMNAQALFKNMIGSLGQISENIAYTISESVTKMAIDYASLYNTSIESAITKFQSALAGQVRPIRSVSGYDITENTLYQLYQSIGGTKTMRQLSRTEKQLLAIYAIFNQMGASGALGDMEKTIDQVANQSRMMAENWEQMATWAGVALQYILQKSGVFKNINALLITTSEIFKSIAYSLGYETPDFANSWADNISDTEEAVDKLQGKLLDFDKFRSLNGAEENILGIDQKLLEAISGYSSEIGHAVNESRKLAEQWLKILGFTDENGDGVYEMTTKAELFVETLKLAGVFLGVLFGKAIINSISKFGASITGITSGVKLLSTVLLSGLIYAIIKAVEAFENGNYLGGILATTIGVVLAGAFIYLNKKAITGAIASIVKFIAELWFLNSTALGSTTLAVVSLSSAFIGLAGAMLGVFLLFQNWDIMTDGEKIIGVIGVLTTAVLGLALAFGVFHSAWSMGLAATGIVAGIVAIVGSIASAKNRANTQVQYKAMGASNIDSGTLFVAGEMGKTEAVFNGTNGKTNVANIQQMQTAFNGALNNWWAQARNDIPQFREVSKTGIYEVVRGESRRRGEL